MRTYQICPEDFGFHTCNKSELVGGTPEENAEITRAILAGDKGPKRDAVLLNSGAAIYLTGQADTIQQGIDMASEAIDSGAAAEQLAKFIQLSNE
jgi:anthranilate phosphoribosyltransferase